MSVRLADGSFQYPVGIAENMLVEVGKFTFPADFVILEIEEDSARELGNGSTHRITMGLSGLGLTCNPDFIMLKSLLNIYDLDYGGWWVALGIASSIGLVTSNETNLVARCRRVYAHAHDYHINSISNNSWVIRAQLEVNTARLKKLVLLAEVSTASRVITAGVLLILLEY
ncbi:reverse transcriptase domain-containing protein [Tanacetum coccineum]